MVKGGGGRGRDGDIDGAGFEGRFGLLQDVLETKVEAGMTIALTRVTRITTVHDRFEAQRLKEAINRVGA